MHPVDTARTLSQNAHQFRQKLAAIRQAHPHVGWYPYDTLANTAHIDALLGDEGLQQLRHLLQNGRCADIGTGDGDFAFLLEHLGCTLDAIDNASSSNNGIAGFETLARELGSQLTLHDQDLDRNIDYPHDDYQIVFLLGVLYHLKNPFLVLDELARRSRYLILSTRLMQQLPSISASVKDKSVAYLVDADELNQDDSNFWIFTEASLARLLKRSHWKVQKTFSLPSRGKSNPVAADRDERVFCFAESHYGLKHLDTLSGWRAPEGASGWRWVEQDFSFRISETGLKGRSRLDLLLYLPEFWFNGISSVSLNLTANGETLAPVEWQLGGRHTLSIDLPLSPAGAWDCRGRIKHNGISAEASLNLGAVVGSCEVLRV